MSIRSDLVAYNRDDQLILLVEVKKKLGASSEWAVQLRRNMLAHGTLPNTKFFLLALPDKFYLWQQNGEDLEVSEPTYTIDSRPILKPYLQRVGITADEIDGQSLELIVSSWLGEIVYSNKPPEEFDTSHQWLIESGLYDALVGGHLEHEAVA